MFFRGLINRGVIPGTHSRDISPETGKEISSAAVR
jgi:hypothetical protein